MENLEEAESKRTLPGQCQVGQSSAGVRGLLIDIVRSILEYSRYFGIGRPLERRRAVFSRLRNCRPFGSISRGLSRGGELGELSFDRKQPVSPQLPRDRCKQTAFPRTVDRYTHVRAHRGPTFVYPLTPPGGRGRSRGSGRGGVPPASPRARAHEIIQRLRRLAPRDARSIRGHTVQIHLRTRENCPNTPARAAEALGKVDAGQE